MEDERGARLAETEGSSYLFGIQICWWLHWGLLPRLKLAAGASDDDGDWGLTEDMKQRDGSRGCA